MANLLPDSLVEKTTEFNDLDILLVQETETQEVKQVKSDKIRSYIIDDNIASDLKTYSSTKIEEKLLEKQNVENFITATADYTASVRDFIFADTSASAFTVLLPTTPNIGDLVTVHDVSGSFATNNLTVDGNGASIMGSTTLTLSTDNETARLLYSGNEWRLV